MVSIMLFFVVAAFFASGETVCSVMLLMVTHRPKESVLRLTSRLWRRPEDGMFVTQWRASQLLFLVLKKLPLRHGRILFQLLGGGYSQTPCKSLASFLLFDWMSASIRLVQLSRNEYNDALGKWRCWSARIWVCYVLIFLVFAKFCRANSGCFWSRENQLLLSW